METGNTNRLHERRLYRRYRVGQPSGFSRCPRCAGLGPIVDIGVGGLSFLFEGDRLPQRRTVDIFFGNDLVCIRNVPCRKVSLSRPASSVKVGHLQFGPLTAKQRSQLQHLINLLVTDRESCLEVRFSDHDD